MVTLPACRHRGELIEPPGAGNAGMGVVACASTHFKHPGFVGALVCAGCPWADLPNDAQGTALHPVPAAARVPAVPRDPYAAIELCRHLGPILERGICNLCGMKGQPFDVHACAVHGRCTVRRYRSDRPQLKVCIRCDDYVPAEGV